MRPLSIVDEIQLRAKVVAVLTDTRTGEKRWHYTKNIVTDAGDLFYAERAALLSLGPLVPIPTNFVDGTGVFDGIFELYDDTPANNAPAKANDRGDLLGTLAVGSDKAIDVTYPLVNDPDADNTGGGVDTVTYRVSYLKTEANLLQISDIIITNPTPGATEPVLMHAEFGTPFDKLATDTLKVFVNHNFNGVP